MISLTDIVVELEQETYDHVCAVSKLTGVSPELYVLCFLHWIVEAHCEAAAALRSGRLDIERILSFRASLSAEEWAANFETTGS